KRHGARERDRLRGLALFDTKASADDDAGRAKRKEAIEALRKDGIEAALSAMLPKLLARRSKGGPAEETARAMILETPPATAMADLAGLAVRDEGFEALSGWEKPLLVVVGDEDAIAPPSDAEAMTAVAGRASWVSLVTVGGAAPGRRRGEGRSCRGRTRGGGPCLCTARPAWRSGTSPRRSSASRRRCCRRRTRSRRAGSRTE